MIVTSSAAPAFIVRLFGSCWIKHLRDTSRIWGTKKVRLVHIGKAAQSPDQKLCESKRSRLKRESLFFRK